MQVQATPELITLKAIRAISSADVILYDALVNSELLEYASSTSEKIFVGKRRGCYSYQQEQINDLIVAKANRYGHVVRLKGGDPFVFGRGSEELEFAQKASSGNRSCTRNIFCIGSASRSRHSINNASCVRKFLGHHWDY